MRFLQPLKRLPQPLAQRLSHIDYEREMALVAVEGESEEILGVVRLSAPAGTSAAEFALIVRSDRQRLGLGRVLMRRLLDYARSHALDEIFGDVLAENARMLDLCRSLGAEIRRHPEDSTLLRAVFRRPAHRSGA
jgi:acetyltransferase